MSSAPREPLTVVGEEVVSGNSETFSKQVDTPAVLKGLRIHCYRGQQFDLQYHVKVEKADGERTVNVIDDLAGRNWVGGNGDVYEFDLRRRLESGDRLIVEVENTDSNGYDYTTSLTTQMDWEPGRFDLDVLGGVL